MRSRFVALALLVAALMAAALPTAGNAAPKHHITMSVVPDPIVFGEPVFIFGQLTGPHSGKKTVVLYQRINPSKTFTVAGTAQTNTSGFYSFTRTDVATNRSYFVRSRGAHSRHVYEKVAAALTLIPSATETDTAHPIKFTGQVEPNKVHVGEHVYLQQQVGAKGDEWKTLKAGTVGPGSMYSITYRFPIAGERDVRVLFRGDARNIRSASDVSTITVKEAQVPSFTISATPQVITDTQSAVVSGVLYKPGTHVPDPLQQVQLWGHVAGAPYGLIGTTTTDTLGKYSFMVTPTHNEVYQARTVAPTPAGVRKSAQLLEVVRYQVSIKADKTSGRVGDTVTFTGTVAPTTSGHVIYLQGLGLDHEWHNIKVGHTFPGSNYSLAWKIGVFGPHVFRTLVPGDPGNATGASPAVTVTVTALPIV